MIGQELAPSEWNWQSRSACRDVDPDVFFPATDREAERAREICSTCSVRFRCLMFALTVQERFGVWGGWTEAERARAGPREHAEAARAARHEAASNGRIPAA